MQKEIDALLRAWSREIAAETELARAVAQALAHAHARRQEMVAEIARGVALIRGEQPEPELDRLSRLAEQMRHYGGSVQ